MNDDENRNKEPKKRSLKNLRKKIYCVICNSKRMCRVLKINEADVYNEETKQNEKKTTYVWICNKCYKKYKKSGDIK